MAKNLFIPFLIDAWPATAPLFLGFAAGTVDALHDKGTGPTTSMHLGVRALNILQPWLNGGVMEQQLRRMHDTNYTLGSKLLGSIGSCWLILFVVECLGALAALPFVG